MSIINEGQHTGEFLVSEGNGSYSREKGTLAQRADPYVDGTILSVSGGKLIAAEAGTEGITDVVGVLYGNYDASGGDVEAVYIDSQAEVKGDLLTFPEESTEGGERAAAIAGLRSIGIKVR